MDFPQKIFSDNFHLKKEEWEVINEVIKPVTLSKGDFFIEEGKICRNSGFILKGVMRYFSYDKDGNDPTCYFSYENHYICDPFAFKKQEPSNINLQALTK